MVAQPQEHDDSALRWQLYNDHQKLAWENIQSSTDSYDQGLLTFASGGLGLSIAFIKDIVPLEHVIWLPLLYTSWAAFAACILTTVGSFQISIKTQEEHIDHCYKYYIDRDESYLTKAKTYSKILRRFTIVAGVFFVLALICTIVFASVNVHKEALLKKENDKTASGIRSTVTDGRSVVPVTPVPSAAGKEDRGQPTPPITKVPGGTTGNTQATPKTDTGTAAPKQTTQSKE
jgi:preprotein translocase subunit SecG